MLLPCMGWSLQLGTTEATVIQIVITIIIIIIWKSFQRHANSSSHLHLITDISSISLDLTPEQRSLLTAGCQGKGKVGCGSLRSLLPPFPFPHTVVLLFCASVT